MSSNIQSPFRMAIQGLLESPKYVGVSVLLSLIAGGLVACFFQTESRTYRGTIRYAQSEGEGALDFATLKDSVLTTELIEQLHAKSGVDDDIHGFRDHLHFTPKGDCELQVSYEGNDGKMAEKVVQTAMDGFVDQARIKKAGLVAELAAGKSAVTKPVQTQDDAGFSLAQAGEKLRPVDSMVTDTRPEKNQSEGTGRVATSITSTKKGGAIDSSLTAPENRTAANQPAANQPVATKPVANQPAATKPAENQPVATKPIATKSVATNSGLSKHAANSSDNETIQAEHIRDQQKILEYTIRRKRDLASYAIKVRLKEKELQRVTQLHQRELVSDAVFEKAQGELELLRAQESKEVQSLERQLEEIHSRIQERAATQQKETNQSSLARLSNHTFVVFRKPLLDEELDVSDQSTLRSSETSFQNVDPVDNEISITETATLSRKHRGNTPGLFAAGFFGSLLCLLGPLFYHEWRTAIDTQPDTGAVFGVPVLGRLASKKIASSDPEKASELLSLAALKIVNRLDFPKGVITIASDDHSSVAVVDSMAKKMRHDGSRVTIAKASDLVQSIDDPPIRDDDKVKSAGRVRLRRMKEQTDYVLVSAPLYEKRYDVESAASFSDGVVLVIPKKLLRSPKTQRIISELNDLSGRLLGVVANVG